jgi:hypothetical protein
LALEAVHHLLGALDHRLGSLGLAGLRAHPVRLGHQRLGGLLSAGALLLATVLVVLTLLEVVLPGHVVEVDLGAVGIEVEHLVDTALEQLDVVADHHQSPAEVRQELAQPHDGVGVEVVRRLVEQQDVGAGEDDPGELDAPPLTARKGLELLAEQAVIDAETSCDLGSLGLGRVAAGGMEGGIGLLVALHAPLVDFGDLGSHLALGLAQASHHGIQAAGGQDPVLGQHLGVAGARVLRQVAESARVRHRARRRQSLTREDLGQRGLAGTVAPDQPDPVPGGDPERDVLHQQARAGAHFELGSGDHGEVLAVDWYSGKWD